MSKIISVESFIKKLRTSGFVVNCAMPLGYNPGLPIIQIKNGTLCMLVPYLRYKTTGVVDKTLVYPIRYTVTVELPEERIVAFSDLSLEKKFGKINFSKPVGYFRHESVKHLNKAEYTAKRKELYSLYDKLIGALLFGTDFTADDEKKMSELLSMLLEPSLHGIYKALDPDFYNRYIK